ncbi:MAG: ABC transporter permease [Bryobacterales bacterium]|nr:ABC transporter permease [Bryobacterales bacterium]
MSTSSGSSLIRFRYSFHTAARLALDSIRAHKLRSFLTLLGVIIGVASVIIVGAAIEGLGVYADQSTAKAFGSDSFMIAQVLGGNLTRKEFFEKLRQNKPIRREDVAYLEQVNGDTTLYSPYRQRSTDIKRNGLIIEDTAVIGVSASMAEIRDLAIIDGRFFIPAEERARQHVVVIGDEIRNALFPGDVSPVGRMVKIDGIDFQVVGVQEKLGSAFGRSQDNSAYIPATVFTRLWGIGQSMAVFGKPRPETGLSLLESLDLTRAALRTRFKARPGQPDNFDNLTPDAIRSFINNILGLIAAVVVPVTCISLVVGGIVIMNIMLVSVTERTREIGIRKSLGAKRFDILLQILIEAVLLASAGGAAGLAIGGAATAVLARAFEIEMQITATYVVLALLVSTVVGVASGWYPASRASKLDPVVALRAE